MRIELFAFDMAGTTVRDRGAVLQAFLGVAAERDLPADPAWIRARMGWDKETVFHELLGVHGRPVGDAAALAERFRAHLAARYEQEPPQAIEGAAEAIDALQRRGVRVAFTTGFARETADFLLERLGWMGFPSVASDEVDRGRPAPDLLFEVMRRAGVTDAQRVGAAGDTPSDLEAATAAGCGLVIGVGTGSHTLDQLAGYSHTHLLPNLTTLAALIDDWRP